MLKRSENIGYSNGNKNVCSLLQIKVIVAIRCQILLPFAKLRHK